MSYQRTKWRLRARGALEMYFRTHSAPRAALTIILSATGIIGLFVSFALLHFGVHEMWLRYPIAVVVAYACCLGMVRLWVEYERRHFDSTKISTALAADSEPVYRGRNLGGGGGRRWWHELGDLGDVSLDGEGCAFVIAIGILVAICAVFVVAISGATSLLAEVFLDAFFVSALYRRLRVAAAEHWLATAVRKTWAKALLVAFLLSLLGVVLQTFAPGSESIGPAIHELFDPYHGR